MNLPIASWVVRLGAVAAALGMMAAPAVAADWPKDGPITLVMPYGPGSGSDAAARALADAIGKRIGQTVVVDNRAGAGGTIGTGYVVNEAKPDGYTFLITGPSPVVNAPVLYTNLPYDPLTLVPISMEFSVPIIWVVNSEFASSADELLEKAKAKPGEVAAFDVGNGSTYQLLHMMFEDAADVELNKVSYKGSSQARLDLLANRVQMIIDYPGDWLAHEKEGTVHILGVADTERSTAFPDVPTMGELGIDYPRWLGWYAMFGPPGLPEDIQMKMNAAMTDALSDPTVLKIMGDQRFTPTPTTPEAVTERMKLEMDILAKVAKERNIKLSF